MIEIVLFAGRILLIALLFLFLIAVMNTGVGLVKGLNRRKEHWRLVVERGPDDIQGLKITVTGPVVVGRAPGADILINAEYVSGRHARFSPIGSDLVIEDLASTNGTQLNGQRIGLATELEDGDLVNIGDVALRISYS
ncbi:MAG: FHA domain-containing protein [Actinomycetia bacterium]|nr:FHA domain-containing protein [Actinomycetes bacterium]